MLFDVLPVLIIFLALLVIVAIVLRRLPDIATIKVDTIQEAQVATAKRQLLVQRLERKIRAASKRAWEQSAPARQGMSARVSGWYERLTEWERQHRVTKPPQVPQGKTIESMLLDAARAREAGDQEAEKLYLEVIRLDHRNATAYFGLGQYYWAAEQNEEARQAFEYALRLDPKDVTIEESLAKLAVEDGRLADARIAFERVIAAAPDNVEYRIGLGDVTLALQDPEAALASFEAAVALEPANPRCLDRLLEACILVGNKRMAVATLKRLAEVNPENNKLIDFRMRVAEMPSRSKKSPSKAA